MSRIDGGALALGAGFVVTISGAVWKSANLRSVVFSSYHSRVALARAGIDERASATLRRLADQVNETLGDPAKFDPTQALADPAELRTQIDEVARLLTARAHLPIYFRRMLNIGPILMVLLLVLLLSVSIALTYFSGWKRARGLGYGGVWGAVGSGTLICVVTGYYFSLLHRFSSAEILAAVEHG